MSIIVPIQAQFCQELPEVKGNIDYTLFQDTLLRMDDVIRRSGVDEILIHSELKKVEAVESENARQKGLPYKGVALSQRQHIQVDRMRALRLSVARHLLGESYRDFTRHLAESPLLQRFCLFQNWIQTNVPGKSTLQRYEQEIPEDVIREMVNQLTRSASEAKDAGDKQRIGLLDPISMTDYYLDTTCLKANIHFPVDWLLLRDGVLTLMKAVVLIRDRGLKNRMDDPALFMREINKLCIQMTHTRRKKDGGRKRKAILRLMKKLCKKVMRHAEKHRNLLALYWEETDLSEAESAQIISRIDDIVSKLPEAMRQAHERIIGKRKVPSKDKILSLYEDDIYVISKGKSGAEVEFGNILLLGEQEDGLIVDWKLYKETQSDTSVLPDSIERIESSLGSDLIKNVTGDRGFDSEKVRKFLQNGRNIHNYICPRSVPDLASRMKEEDFRDHQTRRAQTEGRVGILKNNFLGKPLRSKGFASRDLHVAWGVLAHNLWLLARLPAAEENQKQEVS